MQSYNLFFFSYLYFSKSSPKVIADLRAGSSLGRDSETPRASETWRIYGYERVPTSFPCPISSCGMLLLIRSERMGLSASGIEPVLPIPVRFLRLMAALRSRSMTLPHSGQRYVRMRVSSRGTVFPHWQQRRVLGKLFGARTTLRPRSSPRVCKRWRIS